MSALPKPSQSTSAIISNEFVLEDTSGLAIVFDHWLADLQTKPKQVAPEGAEIIGKELKRFEEEIYFEAARGSKGEVSFQGILHFDGHTLGNIRSPQGILILTKESRVEADIDVRAAIISGSVTGNISAAEYVVLDNDARVAGQIHTRMLSVRLGALFEGDCLFATTSGSLPGDDSKDREKPRQLAMASAASA